MGIPSEILLFYGGWLIFLVTTFYLHWKHLAKSFVMGLGLVIVASEYWETPVFAAGFLGLDWWWPYPSFAFVLHHILVFGIFVVLLFLRRPNIKNLISGLGTGFLCNSILLLPSRSPMPLYYGWIARVIGMLILAGVFLYNDSSLVCS